MSSKISNKERWEKAGEEIAQQQAQPSYVSRYDSVGEKPTEYKAWSDWLGNVNISNLSTGKTNRFHQNVGVAPKRAGRDTFGEDLGQSVGGALQRQGANYKSALATLGLGAAGLLHGDNNYQPEAGSWLWRLQEGAEADTGVANQLTEDSKYGRGTLGRFAMDLTSGAVDLAGDQLLNLVAPGAGMAAMAARSFGGTAEEQREQGKSISTQFFKGLKSAAIEYGTEKFAGIGGRSIEGGGYIDNLLSRAEESIVRKGGNAFLTKLGFAFGSEAVEEMMSDWLNPLADKFLAGVVKGDYDIEDFPSFVEVAYDGLVGGALGLLGGAREGLQAQSRVRSMGGNQGYANFLAQERADTKAQVKDAKKAKKAQLKAIFDYATHHAEQAMDRAKNIKANEASQTLAEAQQVSSQQVTPEAAETPENAPSREFNSKSEAETDVPFTFGEETVPEAAAPTPEVAPAAEENPVVTEAPASATMEAEEAAPRQRGIGKKTGERLAGAALLADVAKQRAAREADSAERGVEVDASDFEDSQPKATAKPNVLVEQAKENGKSRLEKMHDARDRALAQNGIDYRNDPRQKYWNSELGEYNEIDITDGTHGEEEISEYLRDMRQIRLLDALDSWIDKNGPKFFKNGKNNNPESWRAFENAVRDEVRRRVAQQPNDDDFAISKGREEEKRDRRVEAGEASREVAQDKADEARLKGKKRTQKFTENGFTAVPIGNGLYRVTGPSGNTSLEVSAADAADAVQKYKDNLTEKSRKAAKERKAKEAELKKMRDEVQASQENPAQVVGSDGKTYEVTKQLTKSENNYEYVVAELDEDGLPTDMEAEVYRKNASNEAEAVEYAISHPQFFKDGSAEGEVWEQKPVVLAGKDTNGEKQSSENRGAREGSESVGKEARNEQDSVLRDTDAGSEKDGGKPDFHDEYREPENDREKNASDVARKVGRGRVTFRIAKRGANSESRTMGYTTFEDGVIYTTVYENLPDGDIVSNANAGHEGSHGNFIAWAQNEADELAHHLFWNFASYTSEVDDAAELLLNNIVRSYFPDAASTDFWSLNRADRAFVCNEFFAFATSGSALCDSAESAAELDKLQAKVQQFLIDTGVSDPGSFDGCPTFSDYYSVRDDIIDYLMGIPEGERDPAWEYLQKTLEVGGTSQTEATNAKEYAYQKKLAGETGVDEEFAKAAMPEKTDEEKAKSVFGKDYGKVQKAAEKFSELKTRFDSEEFTGSEVKRDKATRQKLSKFRELYNAAAETGDVDSLFSFYESLADDINLSNFYNEEVQSEIDNYSKLVDENLDTYNESAAPYAASRTMQMMAHKFAKANEYQQIQQKMNETLRGSKNGALRKIGKSDKLTAAVARALMRWQVNPDTVFKMVDAFDKGNAGEGYKLAKELQTAHREKYKLKLRARDHFDNVSKMDGFEDFAYGKSTIKDYSGREWDMRSALHVIKTIETIRSTSGNKLGGTAGFGVIDSKGNIEYIDMSEVDTSKLYNSLKEGLSEAASKFGDAATDAFNDFKEPLREKYKENNGIDIEMIGDTDADIQGSDNLTAKQKSKLPKATYSPISYVTKNGEVFQWDIAKQNSYDNIPRFLRERSDNGGTYLLIRPYTEVVDNYFEQASNYLAYSSYAEKVRGLANGSKYETGLATTLAEVFGKDMGNWYKSYVEDLGSYKSEDDVEGVNSLLRQGRQQLQQGALLFSVSVPMKQISSYWAASGILHPDSLIKAYRIKLLKPKNSSDAAAMLASRAMGNLEQSAAEAAKEAEKWLGKLKYSSRFIKFAANAINQMDYNTVSNLLTATEYDVLKYQFNGDTSKIGTAEYNDAVEQLFQDVVDRSQPNYDKQMRAEYGRTDNEVIRMLSMFRTQQTQNLNLLATAIGEYQAAKGTENQAKATETLKQTIAGQAASAFSLSVLTILADMLLHRQKKYEDDDEELDPTKVLTRLGINATEAAAGTMWFGDSIAKWAIDRISGGKTKEFYGVNMGVISTVSDILENFETFMKTPSRSNARYCAGNIASLLGVPLNNAYSMLNSAIMYAKDVTGTNKDDYDDILKYLDAEAKAAKKEEEKAAKAAVKEAEKSGADMLADTAKQNTSQSELNSQEEQKTTEVSSYLKKPYQALLDSGMSSEKSQDLLSFIDTDDNNSIKQAEMFAFYKDNPDYEQYVMAMWNAYGYKTSWESYKAKHK